MLNGMKKICLIPARQDASRFHNKLLQQLIDPVNGKTKTVIRETYERMSSYGLFDAVFVVTNNLEIKEEIETHQGKVIYIPKEYISGTDRIADAAKNLTADIIFNVQGDEPFIDKKPLNDLVNLMEKSTEALLVGSLMKEMKTEALIKSSDYVKVVCDTLGNAIFFSRSVIPHPKKNAERAKYYEHVGVYAFTMDALNKFTQLKPTILEEIESVECLRYIENQIPIKMVETDTFLLEIDTPEDLHNVNRLLSEGVISLV
jgi:3-deoxy-manno-octulosonate cytidylyltransferase (CMP-KDO synthetase)